MQITHAELIGQVPARNAPNVWELEYEIIQDTDDITGWLFGNTPCLVSVFDAKRNDIFYVLDQETVNRLESLIAKRLKEQKEEIKVERYIYDQQTA